MTVKVWDAATGTLQQTLEGHSDWVNSVAFSHDSKSAGVGVVRQDSQGLGRGDGHAAADARGAQRLGQLNSLLAQLEAAGVGVVRQDSQGLGRGDGHATADARGAQRLSQLCSLLARLEAAGVGVRRQDSQGLGRGDGHAAADAPSR